MFNQFNSKWPVLPEIQNRIDLDNSLNLNNRLNKIDQKLKDNEQFSRNLFEDIQKLRTDYIETVLKVGQDFRVNDKELAKINNIFVDTKLDIDRLTNNVNDISQSTLNLKRSHSITDIRPKKIIFKENYEIELNNISKQTNVISKEITELRRLYYDLENQVFDVSMKIQYYSEQQKYARNYIPNENKVKVERFDLVKFINSKINRHEQKINVMSESLNKLDIISKSVSHVHSLILKEKSSRMALTELFSKKISHFDQELNKSNHLRHMATEEFNHLQSELNMELQRIETKTDYGFADVYQKMDLQRQSSKFEQTYQECFTEFSKELISKPNKDRQLWMVSDERLSLIVERMRNEYIHFNKDAGDNATTQSTKIKNIEKRLSEIKNNDDKYYRLLKEKLFEINSSRISNNKNIKFHLNSLDKKILTFKDCFDNKIASVKEESVTMSNKLQESVIKIMEVNTSKYKSRLVQIEDRVEINRTEILEIRRSNIESLLQLIEKFKNDSNRAIQPVEENRIGFENQIEDLHKSKTEVEIEINNHKIIHKKFLSDLAKEMGNNNNRRLKLFFGN